jgi:hypothetical protein
VMRRVVLALVALAIASSGPSMAQRDNEKGKTAARRPNRPYGITVLSQPLHHKNENNPAGSRGHGHPDHRQNLRKLLRA